jgi:hypothetical protein
LVSFFGFGVVEGVAASARPLAGPDRGENKESSDITLASRLVTEGDMTCGRVTIGFGSLGACCSPALSFCIDLLKARVDFIARASESLLSEGRRLPTDWAWLDPRGKAEGHRVKRAESLDDSDA